MCGCQFPPLYAPSHNLDIILFFYYKTTTDIWYIILNFFPCFFLTCTCFLLGLSFSTRCSKNRYPRIRGMVWHFQILLRNGILALVLKYITTKLIFKCLQMLFLIFWVLKATVLLHVLLYCRLEHWRKKKLLYWVRYKRDNNIIQTCVEIYLYKVQIVYPNLK